MKVFVLFSIFILQASYAQVTGNGVETAVNDSCKELKATKKKLIKSVNAHLERKKRIKNLRQFYNLLKEVAVDLNVDNFDNLNKDTIIRKCGEEHVQNILSNRPWLNDKKIKGLIRKLDFISTNNSCSKYTEEIDLIMNYYILLQLNNTSKENSFNPDHLDSAGANPRHLDSFGG
jgi:hypothetical protein